MQTGGASFRIRLRLVDSAQNRQVWERSWEGELSAESYFQSQADIGREVVESLPLATSAGERLLLAHRPTADLEVYRLAAEGQMNLDRRSRPGMERALECFERALELDPAYAPARVGVANALGLLHTYGYRDGSVLPRCEAEIQRALDADPRSAEAHAALGRLLGQRRQEPTARRHIQRAIELKPSYAEAHSWATVGHTIAARRRDALRSSQRAVALNPLSHEAVYNLGMALLINGRPEEALREARRTRKLEPTFDSGVFLETLVLYELRRFPEAAQLLEGLEIPWARPAPRTTLALTLLGSGEPDRAREILRDLRSEGHPFDEGLILAALGRREAAFEAFAAAPLDGFDSAVSSWPTVAARYLFSDVWVRLRNDPRHEALLRRIDQEWGLD